MFGAIGTLIVGGVLSVICIIVPGLQVFAYSVFSMAVSMATAIAYGQYGMALKSFVVGVASMVFSYVANIAGQVIGKALNIFKTVGEKVTDTAAYVWKGALSVYENIAGAVATTAKYIASGMVSSGISRYAMEEINKTGNWFAKVGIALAAAVVLMPVNAFAGGYNNPGLSPGTFVMVEVGFTAMNLMISTEVYKGLEDSLGEEWYSDLLRNGTLSVIGAGLNIAKVVVQNALMPSVEEGQELITVDGESVVVEEKEGRYIAKYNDKDYDFDSKNLTLTRENETIHLLANGNIDHIVTVGGNGETTVTYFNQTTGEVRRIVVSEEVAREIWGSQLGSKWSDVTVDANGNVDIDQIKQILIDSGVFTVEEIEIIKDYFYDDAVLQILGSNALKTSAYLSPGLSSSEIMNFRDIVFGKGIDTYSTIFMPGLGMVMQGGLGVGIDFAGQFGSGIIGLGIEQLRGFIQSEEFQHWDTLGETRFGFDRRSVTIATSVGGAIISGIALPTSFAAAFGSGGLLAGGATVIFVLSGIKMGDCIYNLVGAAYGDPDMMDYDSFNILFTEKYGSAASAAWGGANIAGEAGTVLRGFQNMSRMGASELRSFICDLVGMGFDIRGLVDYLNERFNNG